MGLLNSYNEWKVSRQQQHVSNMQSQNKCPDCNGRGFYTFPVNEFVHYTNPYDCPGCNGSGTYEGWSELR